VINKLILSFSPEENPFEQDKARGLIWGRINLNVVNPQGEILQRVIDMVWDVKELVIWILSNEWFFRSEEFPKEYFAGGQSIAEYRWRYYDLRTDDSIDDLADEILYKYETRHSIKSGMSGTKTISAYIGKRDDRYEISYFHDEIKNWKYDFDFVYFMNGVKEIARKYCHMSFVMPINKN
jgi:hypothetical protein